MSRRSFRKPAGFSSPASLLATVGPAGILSARRELRCNRSAFFLLYSVERPLPFEPMRTIGTTRIQDAPNRSSLKMRPLPQPPHCNLDGLRDGVFSNGANQAHGDVVMKAEVLPTSTWRRPVL